MRYVVVRSIIDILGKDWYGNTIVMSMELNNCQVEIIKKYMTNPLGMELREAVQTFLLKNAGDFQSITDFRADIAIGDEDLITDWDYVENEIKFNDTQYPDDLYY